MLLQKLQRMLYWQDIKNSNKIRRFLPNQDQFGTNCAIEKHTKIPVKNIGGNSYSTDIQMIKYRPIISAGQSRCGSQWVIYQRISKTRNMVSASFMH